MKINKTLKKRLFAPLWFALKWVGLPHLAVIFAGSTIMMNENLTAHNLLKKQAKKYDKQTVQKNIAAFKLDSAAHARFKTDLLLHTRLGFYTTSKETGEMALLKESDGHASIAETENAYLVWRADRQQNDTVDKVLNYIDPVTESPMNVTYNPHDSELTFHLRGANLKDFLAYEMAGTAVWGGINRSTSIAGLYVDSALEIVAKKHDGIQAKDIRANIIAHSTGANLAPFMQTILAAKGAKLQYITLLEPTGAVQAYKAVEKAFDLPENSLESQTESILALDKSVADKKLYDQYWHNGGQVRFFHFTGADAGVGKTYRWPLEGHTLNFFANYLSIKENQSKQADYFPVAAKQLGPKQP